MYTSHDLQSEDFVDIEDKLAGTWRWGTIREAVYKRLCDGTYWMERYWLHTQDGRDCGMDSQIFQVEQIEKTITIKTWAKI